MERTEAAERLAHVRGWLTSSKLDPAVRSDGSIFLIGDDHIDQFTGQQVFDGVAELLDVFELTEPIEGVSTGDLWGPSLVHPSAHTFISPWVVGGEPCIIDTRVPSTSLYALHTDRGLGSEGIRQLYPFLSGEAIDDALQLEKKLRAA